MFHQSGTTKPETQVFCGVGCCKGLYAISEEPPQDVVYREAALQRSSYCETQSVPLEEAGSELE